MGSVTHKPKAGELLTGEEYEAVDAHVIDLTAADVGAAEAVHTHDYEASGAVATHAAAGDPHTGYRLESADHTHASTGLQGGTVAYSDLTGKPTIPTAGTTPSTQAIGDAAAGGADSTFSKNDHKHAMPAFGTGPAAIGTQANGSSANIARIDHVHATGAGTPSTQAFGDSATTGSGPAAAMTDHKHAMPTLGFGLTGNSAPAVSLTNVSAAATATTSISAATYADVTGLSTGALAAGTWLIIATVVGSSVNAHALMHVAITDSANTVSREASSAIPASGSANVASLGSVTVMAIVAGNATYKVRAARGNTTLTGTWVAMDGAGTGTTNNLTDNSDKGSHLVAVRIA